MVNEGNEMALRNCPVCGYEAHTHCPRRRTVSGASLQINKERAHGFSRGRMSSRLC